MHALTESVESSLKSWLMVLAVMWQLQDWTR